MAGTIILNQDLDCTKLSVSSHMVMRNYFNLSISGTWSATIEVQRSFDKVNWYTEKEFTMNAQKLGFETENGVSYRFQVTTKGTGTARVRLSR